MSEDEEIEIVVIVATVVIAVTAEIAMTRVHHRRMYATIVEKEVIGKSRSLYVIMFVL